MTNVIAEFAKNSRETIRVGLTKYNGHELFDLRSWIDGPDGELKPTKSGLTIRTELLPQLEAAIKKATQEARAAGLID